MKIDSNKLKSISNYGKEKGITRQHVYRLIQSDQITSVNIDGTSFVVMDEKSKSFEKQRK